MGEFGLSTFDLGEKPWASIVADSFNNATIDACVSYQGRMDLFIFATQFFQVLMEGTIHDSISPTVAAHTVQRNVDLKHNHKLGIQTATAAGIGCQQLGEVASSGWAVPDKGPLTSRFGPGSSPGGIGSTWHKGLDFAPGCDKPIWAAKNGQIIRSGAAGGYGNLIEIDHGDGLPTRYAHMHTRGIHVKTGDIVTAGQQIGAIGNAGNSTGCHLHFEIRQNGSAINPENYIANAGVTIK